MSNYIVDSADLTSVANAIRTKGGTSAQLAFPADFVSAIGDIPAGGETVYYTKYGHAYAENMVIPITDSNEFANAYKAATNLKSVRVYNPNGTRYTNAITNVFTDCSNLETASVECWGVYGHYWFLNCKKLKTVQIGSVGCAVSSLTQYVFRNDTQSNFTITIYVSDNATLPLTNSPFGATNATIIYRSSTTGEVISV